MDQTQTAVEFREISKDYGSGFIVRDFNLSIPQGKIITIIGPSGCGKTTVLKMVNRLIEPDKGTILIGGRDIKELDPVQLRRNIGYVIQQIGLFPHMTIEENISIVSRLKGESKKQTTKRTEELLTLIGLDAKTFRKRYPHELSGGQQQRVGVARALASDPSIILMDEPFSALDPISRVQLQKELKNLNKQLKKTIIFVTHDIDEALKIADQIILLNEGKIVQYASPNEILSHPGTEFVRQFIGEERFQLNKSTPKVENLMVNSHFLLAATTVREALQIMEQENQVEMIVTSKDQTVLGVIGKQEVKHYLSMDPDVRVAEIMRIDIPQVYEYTKVSEVLSLIKNYSVIPVTDYQQKLLGAVTRSNVIDSYQKYITREQVIS